MGESAVPARSSTGSLFAGDVVEGWLWDAGEILNNLLRVFEKLDEDMRAELPLKRIWTLADDEGLVLNCAMRDLRDSTENGERRERSFTTQDFRDMGRGENTAIARAA